MLADQQHHQTHGGHGESVPRNSSNPLFYGSRWFGTAELFVSGGHGSWDTSHVDMASSSRWMDGCHGDAFEVKPWQNYLENCCAWLYSGRRKCFWGKLRVIAKPYNPHGLNHYEAFTIINQNWPEFTMSSFLICINNHCWPWTFLLLTNQLWPFIKHSHFVGYHQPCLSYYQQWCIN